MNITPEQARELLDGATPGPWGRTGMGVLTDTDGKVIVNGPDGNLDDSDANLAAAAALYLALVDRLRVEWAAQVMEGGEWLFVKWGPSDVRSHAEWVTEAEAKNRVTYWRERGDIARLVRRLVSEPVEVVTE